MGRHRNKHHRTFQQRQTERRQHEEQKQLAFDTALEDMAVKYCCSRAISREFTNQCLSRLEELEFDLKCSRVALEFWSAPTHIATPVSEVFRNLVAEHERHASMLVELNRRLTEITENAALHQHLPLPIGHYENRLRVHLLAEADEPSIKNDSTPEDS
jgi:hypothetical protein